MEELKDKVEKYLERAKPLFAGLKVKEGGAGGTEDRRLKTENSKAAAKVLEMAMAYYNDAKHFYEKGEYVNALGALEYAEGWMDAGKEIGLLE